MMVFYSLGIIRHCHLTSLCCVSHLHLIFLPTHFPNGIVARSGLVWCEGEGEWVPVIMQMQVGRLTSSISRDNGPVLFSNRVLVRQSVKYCCKHHTAPPASQTASFPARPFLSAEHLQTVCGSASHTSHPHDYPGGGVIKTP